MNIAVAEPLHKRDQKEVAFRLLVELLAYQLASPVRWIETQNELLIGSLAIRRFIEIGPRATLANMVRRSAGRQHGKYAPSQLSRVQFLSYQEDINAILYQCPVIESVPKPTSEADPSNSPSSAMSASGAIPNSQKPEIRNTGCPGASSSVEGFLTASHIVLTITAQKLRRPFDRISVSRTIRELCGGKSTLQNELVGDLVAEFGKVPEGVEDMPLSALGEYLQGGFPGRPGKQMAALISRLISSKMPAGFNYNSMQEHLCSRWGLSKSHTAVVICLATSIEPQTRLADIEAVRVYLDELVSRYAVLQGISLVPFMGEVATQHDEAGAVNSSKLDKFIDTQQGLHRRQMELLANYLQIDLGNTAKEARNCVEHESLKTWVHEFDEQFLQGIKPIFSAEQGREYNSWWNWVREQLVRLLRDLGQGASNTSVFEARNEFWILLNRWHPSCNDIITFALDSLGPLHYPDRVRPLAPKVHEARDILEEIRRKASSCQSNDPVFIYSSAPMRPKTVITDSGQVQYIEIVQDECTYPDILRKGRSSTVDHTREIPFIHIRSQGTGADWTYDVKMSRTLLATLDTGIKDGLTYTGKTVLVTGAGPNSIGAQIIQGLLSGGARVVVTTSRHISETALFYQRMYRHFGAKGASLTVLPFNQASKHDCKALIEYIYGANSPVGGGIDYVIPFAAISQSGELHKIDPRSELAFRIMLVNLFRLVGCIHHQKEKQRSNCRPTMIIVPMSCNEGTFGGDGLYAESKIALKTLFNRFHSERWSNYVTICGAVIGWTRGTGLMHSSDILAERVEDTGVITFSQSEMAFNILALMSPELSACAEETPIYADLTGGLESTWDIKAKVTAIRTSISQELELRRALAAEEIYHRLALFGDQDQQEKGVGKIDVETRRAFLNLCFPLLECHEDLLKEVPSLQGMIDLSHTVVVVGFSELGPWGNSRTRWEMEHRGTFSLEGYVEMAWIMGFIQHVDGTSRSQPYIGWVDTTTKAPVRDDEIPHRYHDRIMSNAGVRLIEPEGVDDYIPSQKEYLQEVAVEEDLPPFECSRATGEAFKLRHGHKIALQAIQGSDQCRVFVKKGAVLMLGKIVPFHQSVAGPIPTGWNPIRYGIPEDIVQQVDTTTLYALCCVSEAFLSAGIEDPYEIYRYIHVSELANCLGTGGGPMKIIRNMYRDRFLDRQVRSDILLEHFLNTMGAWVNMLLLSAAGPLKTPVGACATALESLDIGCDAITSGKCKVALVGGCDDYREELSFEFDKIKATANCNEEFVKGRMPNEISRPTASSRNGFVESAGCGVQILMTAELAIEMGLPIYGIVAYSQMASDQIGRSIPAPGKGILTVARGTEDAKSSPLLDLRFRRSQFEEDVVSIGHCITEGQPSRAETCDFFPGGLEQAAKLRLRDAQHRWAHNLRLQDPAISPITAALATWGLRIDDVRVASMHGTSTKINDINEGAVINRMMEHLGRSKGNPLLSVCQKWLTGHPKAASGAFQLNGVMQILRDEIVPGNRNADNIDKQLQHYEHLVYLMESIYTTRVKAAMLTSFGFGQKGAVALIVAARYVFASLDPSVYGEYRTRVAGRQKSANTAFITRILKNSLVQVKSYPPWDGVGDMEEVFLDPNSRQQGRSQKTIREVQSEATTEFGNKHTSTDREEAATVSFLVQNLLADAAERSNAAPLPVVSLGVDLEDVININIGNDTFLHRNFTEAEREYCFKAANPRASFAGRWSAKEAVFKSLQTPSRGAGTEMNEIEILSEQGIPRVTLHGRVKSIADGKGIGNVEVTISHSCNTAIAIALAMGTAAG
ncbi:hypothetical protein BDV25DRAFT_168999 [Aspergillus avenaceus]|uniref:Uncharacterized protein n=1 Tax=Aspergillus avenaceus TaxID=36643 RepID=A0A5N6U4K2_ASPAV|nr:hypothetical protein BDV25DRAFT_168999 [Aspergillus avenaceus]